LALFDGSMGCSALGDRICFAAFESRHALYGVLFFPNIQWPFEVIMFVATISRLFATPGGRAT
jgi:hypothetical protein